MARLCETLSRVMGGTSDANVRFAHLRALLKALRFAERITGSHHVFGRDGVAEIINLQPDKSGRAKRYQVKQVRRVLAKYGLDKELRDED
ncbi:MAG: type II toxin-antitoxin system HicA family toxin [Gemmatimonadetes bacterium]|nr:type II toxin-antitoxin system HicA family toxin [Gemmatimonadota bacterium]